MVSSLTFTSIKNVPKTKGKILVKSQYCLEYTKGAAGGAQGSKKRIGRSLRKEKKGERGTHNEAFKRTRAGHPMSQAHLREESNEHLFIT